MRVDEASHSDGNILNILRLMITIKCRLMLFDLWCFLIRCQSNDSWCDMTCHQHSPTMSPRRSKAGAVTRSTAWQFTQFQSHKRYTLIETPKWSKKMQLLVKDIVKDVSKGFFFGRGPDVTSYAMWPLWRHRTPRYVSPGCCCRYTYGEASVPP